MTAAATTGLPLPCHVSQSKKQLTPNKNKNMLPVSDSPARSFKCPAEAKANLSPESEDHLSTDATQNIGRSFPIPMESDGKDSGFVDREEISESTDETTKDNDVPNPPGFGMSFAAYMDAGAKCFFGPSGNAMPAALYGTAFAPTIPSAAGGSGCITECTGKSDHHDAFRPMPQMPLMHSAMGGPVLPYGGGHGEGVGYGRGMMPLGYGGYPMGTNSIPDHVLPEGLQQSPSLMPFLDMNQFGLSPIHEGMFDHLFSSRMREQHVTPAMIGAPFMNPHLAQGLWGMRQVIPPDITGNSDSARGPEGSPIYLPMPPQQVIGAMNAGAKAVDLASPPKNYTTCQIPSQCFMFPRTIMTVFELAVFRSRDCPNPVNCKQRKWFNRCPWTHDTPRWKRRSPFGYEYKHLMCPNIGTKSEDRSVRQGSQCQAGIMCGYAHSIEEQMYHPHVYKTTPCRNGEACNKFFCPFLHEGEWIQQQMVQMPGRAHNRTVGRAPQFMQPPFNHLEVWSRMWSGDPMGTGSRQSRRDAVSSGDTSDVGDLGSGGTESEGGYDVDEVVADPLEPWSRDTIPCEVVVRARLFFRNSDTLSPLELSVFRIQRCLMRSTCPGVKSPAVCWSTHQNTTTSRWQRRNPFRHPYKHLLCESVRASRSNRVGPISSVSPSSVACLRERACLHAHSIEEQMYHPFVYKSSLCSNQRNGRICEKHFCPFIHDGKTTPRAARDARGTYASLWLSAMKHIDADEMVSYYTPLMEPVKSTSAVVESARSVENRRNQNDAGERVGGKKSWNNGNSVKVVKSNDVSTRRAFRRRPTTTSVPQSQGRQRGPRNTVGPKNEGKSHVPNSNVTCHHDPSAASG